MPAMKLTPTQHHATQSRSYTQAAAAAPVSPTENQPSTHQTTQPLHQTAQRSHAVMYRAHCTVIFVIAKLSCYYCVCYITCRRLQYNVRTLWRDGLHQAVHVTGIKPGAVCKLSTFTGMLMRIKHHTPNFTFISDSI